jgi:hypothetical protein
MEDVNFGVMVWVTLAVFLGPTIGAMIWAGSHDWDVGEGTAHPT